MNKAISIADGNCPAVKSAAQDANAVQDAINLIVTGRLKGYQREAPQRVPSSVSD